MANLFESCMRILVFTIVLWMNKWGGVDGGPLSGALCNSLGDCNGHGNCNTQLKDCDCHTGWGATTDIADYKAPDCSLRVCPSGTAWNSIPTAATTAHAVRECSGMGICDRKTGFCTCFKGFSGAACHRSVCPNDCSGHGRCVSMKQMATMTNALPLSAATTYKGAESTTTWDQNKIFGCVCDSSWTVGLAASETQEPEWFGADCSLKHCPSGNDPETTADETDCSNVLASGGKGTGASGNKCHVDCANNGICDYKTGLCKCFTGFYGGNCASLSPIS